MKIKDIDVEMTNPIVSIIMGVYNAEKSNMLQQAIESILNQTMQNFEFIICDDASTDSSYNILQSYMHDSRIVVIKNDKNRGLAYSLNKCISIAKGKYIVRQDADDYSDTSRLNVLVEYIESHPNYDIVGSNIKYFDESGLWGKYVLPQYPQKKDFLFTVPFIHATVILKKESILKVGGYRVHKETFRCEDYDLFMTMYSKGMRGANIQRYLYNVREDSAAQKRRKYKYRIDEAKVRLSGYRKLKLLPIGYLYALKPLLVGLIPTSFLKVIKDKYYQRRSKK